MTALCPATILTNDIYKRLYKQDAGERHLAWATRIVIVILGLTAMGVASYLPPILAAIAWVNGWLIPILWLFVAGLFWQHSTMAAALTIGITWLVNSLWSLTELPQWLNMSHVDNTYIVVGTTIVVGLLSGMLFGNKPPYIKTTAYRERVAAFAN